MTDEQLARNLQSVGQACFVEYFECFTSESMSREDIVEKLKAETNYTENSCVSRTGHAKKIIQAGLAKMALQKVVSSDSPKVSVSTRAKAQELLQILHT